MKNKILLSILVIVTILTTGCFFKRDEMEDINIITTIYPIEYITNRLYGDKSNISSIYPNGVNVSKFNLTKKQIKDYSSKDLFIYNGESDEKEYAKALLNKNHNLKIIDSAYGLDTTYSSINSWLNPSNLLMLAQNIKNELSEYITNPYLIDEINNQYDLLKIDVSELEAELKTISDASEDKRIIVADESLNFLSKYGFEVINLKENNVVNENNLSLAKDLLANKKLNYIFTYNENDETIKDLKENYDGELLIYDNLETLKENNANNNEDYLSIMYKNIELLKKETY